MSFKRYHIILLLTTMQIVSVFGSPKDKTIKKDSIFRTVSVFYDYGFVIPHHPDIVYFMEDFTQGAELTYGITNYRSNSWSKYFNYPEVGVAFSFSTFGNKDIFGNGLALYPYMHTTILRTKHFYLRNKLSMGLGYVTKPFDIISDPYNMINGSRLNIFIGFGLYGMYKINNHWFVKGKVTLNHYSNGATKKPNNGMNILSAGIGVGYSFNPEEEPVMKKIKAPREKKRSINVTGAFGGSRVTYYDNKFYPAASLNISHKWFRSVKTAWGAGIDLIYYGAAPYTYTKGNDPLPLDDSRFYGAVQGTYNMLLGRIDLFIQLGVYVLYDVKPRQPVYPRLGVRYHITKELEAVFDLKGSFFKAEFLEFGLGYEIFYGKNRN